MKYRVTLNGVVYEVEVEKGQAVLTDEYEAYAPAAPAPAPVAPAAAAPAPAAPAAAPVYTGSGEAIAAPLPGKLLSVSVKAGESVKAGQILAIIEAMKMENEVLSPRAGKVVSVMAQAGQSVATGDTLLVLE